MTENDGGENQTKSDSHIKQEKLTKFQGNLRYSSINQLNFQTTSRRDDLISMFYVLVTLLHDGNLPVLRVDNSAPAFEELLRMRKVKQHLQTSDFCLGNSNYLKEFKEEILRNGFEDRPRYEHLRGLQCGLNRVLIR